MKKKNNIKIKNNSLEVKKNLEKGLHYYKLEQYQESQLFLEKVLQLDPLNFSAIFISSVIAYRTKNYQLSAELALICLNIKPNDNNLKKHYAYVLKNLKLYEKSIKIIKEAINDEPENGSLYKCLASIYESQECHQQSIIEYENAAKFDPTDPDIFNSLGVQLDAINQNEKAIENYKKSLSLKPNFPQAYSNMALSYLAINAYETAENAIVKAIDLDSSSSLYLTNHATIKNVLNETDEAIESLKKALAIDDGYKEASYNLALTLLSIGQYQEAWKYYDSRWEVKSFNSKRFAFNKPVLELGSQAECLLIYGEQGLGDQILYASILSKIHLVSRKTIVLVEKRLLPLLQRSFKEIHFIENIDTNLNFDKYIALGSIGRFFINNPDDFLDQKKAFLIADRDRAKNLRNSLGIKSGTLLCGISWNSKSGKTGKNKSLTLDEFLPLFNLPKIQFVNLQYGNVEEELREFEHKHGIKILQCDSVDNMQDIDGLASLVEACDFVVTCSNTTTHIVGGLGKECYLMTPSNAGSLWYWGNVKDGRSLWYPSIQIFKQPSLNNWAGAMNLIVDKIKQKYLV